MLKISRFLERHSSLILILATCLGLFLMSPAGSESLKWLILPMLFTVMLLAALKINYQDFREDLKQPFKILFLILNRSILSPLLIYLVLSQIFPKYDLGIMLIVFTPTAVACASLTSLFKGRISQSILITIGSSIAANILIPLMVYLFQNTSIELDHLAMAKTIFLVIILPITIAYLLKKLSSKSIENSQPYYNGLTILILFFFLAITVGLSQKQIFQNIEESITIGLIHLLIIALFIISAKIINHKSNKESQISTFISYIFSNNALTIGLSVLYFDPATTYFLIISEITWALSIPIWKKLQAILIKET